MATCGDPAFRAASRCRTIVGCRRLCLAKSSGVTPQSYESNADGLLENVDGVYAMTDITVRPRVVLKSDADLELARTTMAGVEARCFMAQSVKAKVTLVPDFTVG